MKIARVREIGLAVGLMVFGACSNEPETTVVPAPREDETEVEKASRELAEEKEKLKLLAEKTRIAEEKAAMEAKLAAAMKEEEEARLERIHQEEGRKRAEIAKKAAAEKARNLLLNTKLDKLVTARGTIYKLVTINKITPGSLGIIHDGGAASVPFGDLTAEWKAKVHFDPVEAEKYADERQAKVENYKEAVAANKRALQDEIKESSKQAATEATFEIPEDERKLQALLEKYVNLHKKTEVDLSKAYTRRNSLTPKSANWNTEDKRILTLSGQSREYHDQVRRYERLLFERETARIKAQRYREAEERRRARAK